MKKRPPRPAPLPPAKDQILWLLEFLREDLSRMKAGKLLDLRNEVFANLHEATRATMLADDPDHAALRPAHAEESDPVVALARELMSGVQRELKAGVESLERSGSWWPFGIEPNLPAPRWSLERRSDGSVFRAYIGTWRTITIASASDLFAQWWPELRFCAYDQCRALFLPEEPRQKYHVPKCSADARWRRLPKRDLQKEKERKALRNGPGRGRKKR